MIRDDNTRGHATCDAAFNCIMEPARRRGPEGKEARAGGSDTTLSLSLDCSGGRGEEGRVEWQPVS